MMNKVANENIVKNLLDILAFIMYYIFYIFIGK